MLVFTMFFAFCWKTCEDSIKVLNETKVKRNWKYGLLILSILGTFLPMYLINSCMSYVGNDYVNYYTYYQNIVSGKGQDVEIGYKLINIFVAKIGLGFQGIYFITCFIAYGLLMICIRIYSQNYVMSYLLFFSGGFFFLLGLNQIRQFVAVGCVFLAYHFIEKKKPIIYFGLVILGGLFHVTAFVMLPFYFILEKKIRLSMYVVGALVILPINIFFNDIMVWLFQTFMPRYLNSNYISKEYTLEVPYLTMVIVTILIALFLASQENKSIDGIDRIFFNGCMISLVLVTVCTWLPEYKRFVYYFFIPTIFYIPRLLDKEKRFFVKLAILLILIVGEWIYVSSTLSFNHVLPYKTFF